MLAKLIYFFKSFFAEIIICFQIVFGAFILVLLVSTIAEMYFTHSGANKQRAFEHAQAFAAQINEKPDAIHCRDDGECYFVFPEGNVTKITCPTLTNKELQCKIIKKTKINFE